MPRRASPGESAAAHRLRNAVPTEPPSENAQRPRRRRREGRYQRGFRRVREVAGGRREQPVSPGRVPKAASWTATTRSTPAESTRFQQYASGSGDSIGTRRPPRPSAPRPLGERIRPAQAVGEAAGVVGGVPLPLELDLRSRKVRDLRCGGGWRRRPSPRRGRHRDTGPVVAGGRSAGPPRPRARSANSGPSGTTFLPHLPIRTRRIRRSHPCPQSSTGHAGTGTGLSRGASSRRAVGAASPRSDGPDRPSDRSRRRSAGEAKDGPPRRAGIGRGVARYTRADRAAQPHQVGSRRTTRPACRADRATHHRGVLGVR